MKTLIVGLGSMGRRHLSNLKAIDPTMSVTVCRRRAKREDQQAMPPEADNLVYGMNDALASSPDAALIACPASRHIEIALALAHRGVHLFIEKPLSHTIDGVDELIALCRERSVVLMVGYNLRFDPSLQTVRQALLEGQIGRILAFRAEVGQFLPDWRPDRDYRETVSALRSLGGGVVMELSHELDYARWLIGEVRTVSAQTAQVSDLEIDVEDVAEITLEFSNGAIGNIHLDMIQRAPTRGCRMIGTEGTLTWDGITRKGRLFRASTGAWTDLPSTEPDRNAAYLAEMRHFLECVAGRQSPLIDGEEGRRTLEMALAVRQSSMTGQVVKL